MIHKIDVLAMSCSAVCRASEEFSAVERFLKAKVLQAADFRWGEDARNAVSI
jgi:hypothetical protein